jgi:hypothetical protein
MLNVVYDFDISARHACFFFCPNPVAMVFFICRSLVKLKRYSAAVTGFSRYADHSRH